MRTFGVDLLYLFRHGAAVAVYEGLVPNGEKTLTFRESQMDDVVGSLDVRAGEGARVVDVTFETPEDLNQKLHRRNQSELLHTQTAMFTILQRSRGRLVTIVTKMRTTVTGTVVGIDTQEKKTESGTILKNFSILTMSSSNVETTPLDDIKTISFDDNAAEDLQTFLDAMRGANSAKLGSITIRGEDLKTQQPVLRASFKIAAPQWGVRFNVDLDTEEETGKIALYGVIHNPLEDDIANATVVMTTGRPVSFTTQMYRPKMVEREVRDDGSAARKGGRGVRPQAMVRAASLRAESVSLESSEAFDDYMGEVEPQAAEGQAGPSTTYTIDGLSMKRGGSAIVPLSVRTLPMQRKFVWNASSNDKNPSVMVTAQNTLGVTLESGPVMVSIDGQYAGEAMMPLTTANDSIELTYAKAVQITVGVRYDESSAHVGFTTDNGAVVRIARSDSMMYVTLTSQFGTDEDVLLDVPMHPQSELRGVVGAELVSTKENVNRFKVRVPAHSKVECAITHSSSRKQFYYANNMTERTLADLLVLGSLSDEMSEKIKEMAAINQKLDTLTQNIEKRKWVIENLTKEIKENSENVAKLDKSPTGLMKEVVDKLGNALLNLIDQKDKETDLLKKMITELDALHDEWQAKLAKFGKSVE